MQKLKQIDVKGKMFEVSINEEGHFFAEYEHEQIRAESLKQLTEKLAGRIAKSKRVNIPFCMWEKNSWNDDPGRIRTGTIFGLHANNNNLLVKFDDEAKSEQLSYGSFFNPMDADELKRLAKTLNAAQEAFNKFKQEHEFDARDKVRELLGVTNKNDAA